MQGFLGVPKVMASWPVFFLAKQQNSPIHSKMVKLQLGSHSDIVTRAAWFSGKIRDLLPKGCRFDSHSEKFSLIKEVNVPI